MEDNKLIKLTKKPSPQQLILEDNVNKPDLLSEYDELKHYGVPEMRWGIRRYQNLDGTLTPLGKQHLAELRGTNPRKADKFEKKLEKNKVKMEKRKAQRIRMKRQYEEYKKAHTPKENKKRFYINRGPKGVANNIDLYSEDELRKLHKRFEWQNSLYKQAAERSINRKSALDRLLSYGTSANDAIRLLNSPAGKSIREALGYDPNEVLLNYDPKYYGGRGGGKKNNRNKNNNHKKNNHKNNNRNNRNSNRNRNGNNKRNNNR